jgi:hypothetical protein
MQSRRWWWARIVVVRAPGEGSMSDAAGIVVLAGRLLFAFFFGFVAGYGGHVRTARVSRATRGRWAFRPPASPGGRQGSG